MKNLFITNDKNNVTKYIKENYFVLVKNTGWNDYSFRTAFSLYILLKEEFTLIGEVKILKKGQIDDGNFYLEDGEIETLNEDFCSIGQSLDYYERLSELKDEEKYIILNKLNDIVFLYDENTYYENNPFSKEDGYYKSLFRYIGKDDDILLMSKIILEKRYDSLPQEGLIFSFQPNNWEDRIEINFKEYSPNFLIERKTLLPNNIACIIGSNGTGKSTFLSRLARIAYATKKDRMEYPFGGNIEPIGLGFPRIISISYSAFDNFTIPGNNIDEKRQIINDMVSGKGRYFYCGLRDIVNEELKELNEDQVVENILKSMQKLSTEFKNKLIRIREQNRIILLKETLIIFKKESSFEKILSIFERTQLDYNQIEDIGELFLKWSTGHKIIMHIIVNLIAHIEHKTLVLLDEPENHLHPPLLSIFMHALRYILRKKKSYCLTATHSPVVLQETLSKDVYVLTQNENKVKVSKPNIQTFAEAIGTITSEVFELNSSISDYHKVLRAISQYAKYEEVLEAFEGEISTQGRAYLISYFAKKDSNG